MTLTPRPFRAMIAALCTMVFLATLVGAGPQRLATEATFTAASVRAVAPSGAYEALPRTIKALLGAGVAFADFDGDKLPDALIVARGAKDKLLLNGAAAESGLALRVQPAAATGQLEASAELGCVAVAALDADGDGDADALVIKGGAERSLLMSNDGKGAFTANATALPYDARCGGWWCWCWC